MGQIQQSIGALFSSPILGTIGREQLASAKLKEAEMQLKTADAALKHEQAQKLAEQDLLDATHEANKDPQTFREYAEASGHDIIFSSDVDKEVARRAELHAAKEGEALSKQKQKVKTRFDKRKSRIRLTQVK